MQLPAYVAENQPYRPDLILWLALPDDIVVGSEVVDPRKMTPTFGDSLRTAMERPRLGPARRPSRVRVSDENLAREVQTVLGPAAEVVVGPTPELDALVDDMMRSMPAGGAKASYLEGGRVAENSIGRLFQAAALLFRVTPWKRMSDDQVIRLDAPSLGVEGACISVLGMLGERLGLAVFPSLDALEAFSDGAESDLRPGSRPDLGTTVLSLCFERAADLPPSMRREVAKHGWPMSSPNAFPLPEHRERDGVLRPMSEQDVALLTRAAEAVSSLYIRHGDEFHLPDFAVSESFSDDDDRTVRLTYPYEAWDAFEPGPAPSPRAAPSKVGRNDPCPCGSGKKYKKCHLDEDAGARRAGASVDSWHEIDQRLVWAMQRYAAERFGEQWHRAADPFEDPEGAIQLFAPWSVFHFLVGERPVVAWFIEERGAQLTPEERAWLEAQRRAWISIWEVHDLEPGRSLHLRDLLTGEERHVIEVRGSKNIARRDCILGRIVEWQGASLLCGAHPRPLPPRAAANVERQMRGRIRLKGKVPPERLRHAEAYAIDKWEDSVAEVDVLRSLPPELRNTDGDLLVMTIDHFHVEPGKRDRVWQQLASMPNVEAEGLSVNATTIVFTRHHKGSRSKEQMVVIARATLGGRVLTVETNSVERAAELRRQIETTCKGMVRHRSHEQIDPRLRPPKAVSEGNRRPGRFAPAASTPEAVDAIRQFKEQHYAGWVDEPLPALAGKTARQSIRTKSGRQRVDLLLREMENQEQGVPEAERFDFSKLRSALGLLP